MTKKPATKDDAAQQETASTTTETPLCPICGKRGRVVPIVYGLPGIEAQKDAERGKYVLGGCVVNENSPDWYCLDCKAEIPIPENIIEMFGHLDYFHTCPHTHPHYPSQEVRNLVKTFHDCGLSDHDYLDNMKKLTNDWEIEVKELIPTASKETICTILTYIIASDRFVDGAVAGAVANGTIAALLDRLKDIEFPK